MIEEFILMIIGDILFPNKPLSKEEKEKEKNKTLEEKEEDKKDALAVSVVLTCILLILIAVFQLIYHGKLNTMEKIMANPLGMGTMFIGFITSLSWIAVIMIQIQIFVKKIKIAREDRL